MAVRAMRQMFATIRELQADRQEGNPFLQILGVVPTMYSRQWREHNDFLEQMAELTGLEFPEDDLEGSISKLGPLSRIVGATVH